MRSFTEQVDAVKARRYLTGSDTKRSASPNVVSSYTRDMLNDEWRLIHTGLAFRKAGPGEEACEHGILIDGGQRMLAVIGADAKQPGITVPFWVTTGADPDSFDAIDTGRKRTMANVLEIKGIGTANYVQLGSVARRGVLLGKNMIWNSAYAPSRNEIIDFIASHPGLIPASDFYAARKFPRGLSVARSIAGLSYWVLGCMDRDTAQEYLEAIRLGVNLDEGNAALYLRNRMISGQLVTRPDSRRNGAPMPQYRGKEPELTLALIFAGWEKWLAGRPVTSIRIEHPVTNSNFPMPYGLKGWDDPCLAKPWD